MSAIAGVFCLDGRPMEEAWVRRMTETLAHRGPDGAGVWVGQSVGVGHRMLHVTPESLHEKQPLVFRGRDFVVTADARIDNRDELIRRLGLRCRPGEPVPDSALILAAYERWGDACPERLIGDFAFAIWDGRTRSLFCARDPMGVKPFYYFKSDRLFAFASEMRALFCLAEVPRRLNELQIGYFLAGEVSDREITFFDGVARLPAATSLRVGSDMMQERRYWKLDVRRDVRFSSDVQYVEAFREVFGEAVRARLRSAFPIGSALSGGLDSSSIASMARDQLRQQQRPALHTFSAVFPSASAAELPRIDERPFIETVIRMGGVVAHEVRADLLSPLGEIDRLLWHAEEPMPSANMYIHHGMYAAAQQSGVRVFLDGLDGDSAVSLGFGRFGELAQGCEWDLFAAEVRLVARRWNVPVERVVQLVALPYLDGLARRHRWFRWVEAAVQFRRRFRHRWRRLLRQHALRPIRDAWLARRGRQPDAEAGFVAPEFARQIGLQARRRAMAADEPWCATEREAHIAAIENPLFQPALEVADKLAAGFGMEPRYPFFDRRLLEFCVALPAEQKLAGGWSRVILRHAMEGVLPPEIQWRGGKGDLSSNFYRGFAHDDASLVDEALCCRADLVGSYVDLPGARAAVGAMRAGMHQRGVALYSAVLLGLWLCRTQPVHPAAGADERFQGSAVRWPAGAGEAPPARPVISSPDPDSTADPYP